MKYSQEMIKKLEDGASKKLAWRNRLLEACKNGVNDNSLATDMIFVLDNMGGEATLFIPCLPMTDSEEEFLSAIYTEKKIIENILIRHRITAYLAVSFLDVDMEQEDEGFFGRKKITRSRHPAVCIHYEDYIFKKTYFYFLNAEGVIIEDSFANDPVFSTEAMIQGIMTETTIFKGLLNPTLDFNN